MPARSGAKTADAPVDPGPLPVGPDDLRPMEAKAVSALPDGEGWVFEPKWDGFRCLAFRSGDVIDLRAKSGKPLARYFPEMVACLRDLPADRFVLDGELAIPQAGHEGETLSFDALQMRLHPAESRVRRLAAETPAVLILFDLPVAPGGTNLLSEPLERRRAALERLWADLGAPEGFRLSPVTRDREEAECWLARSGAGALDGVVAKRLCEPYRPGERAVLKVKRQRSADCVVGGFRYATRTQVVGSLLLGLYDESGRLNHVGFTSNIPPDGRRELTARLNAMVEPPGFTGDAPGGPSRWATERSTEWRPLRPELVVEVRFDQVTGGRFRHGTAFQRWRPDKAPWQCTREQLNGAIAAPPSGGADGEGG